MPRLVVGWWFNGLGQLPSARSPATRCPIRSPSRLIALITERHASRPGDRLPPERELAAMMGVSRSSLRQAPRAPAMLGVAEMRQGDGTYLTTLEPELADAPGRARAGAERLPGWTELFEARKLVEPGLAVARRRADQRRRRRAELQRCAEASPRRRSQDPEAFMWARHRAAREDRAGRATTPILERLLESIAGMGIASRRRTGRQAPGARAAARTTIVEIAAAIAAHDAEAAQRAMLRHLENVERAVTG